MLNLKNLLRISLLSSVIILSNCSDSINELTPNKNIDQSTTLVQNFGILSNNKTFLDVDKAFIPIISALNSNTLEIAFQISPEYYLYKEKISLVTNSKDVKIGHLDLPRGLTITDEWFGKMEIYREEVFAKTSVARATINAGEITVSLAYQGCADAGLCYPPQIRNFTVSLPKATSVNSNKLKPIIPISEQGRLAELISKSNIFIIIATFFIAGLLLSLTPCALPMLPILSGIIAGGNKNNVSKSFNLAISYVLGMSIVYTLLGIAAAAIGIQLQAFFNAPWIIILFSGFFIFLAFGMFGYFDLQVPEALQNKMTILSGKQARGTYIGAFIMGALSSLIVTACVAPPLVAAFMVIGQTGNVMRGGIAIFSLSLGMGVPLLLLGASAGKILPKTGEWMTSIKKAFGFMMLALSIWMISRIIPGNIALALWGILFLSIGIYLIRFLGLSTPMSINKKTNASIGIVASMYGAAMLIGAFLGNSNPIQPLAGIVNQTSKKIDSQKLIFKRIKSIDDLNNAVVEASKNNKNIMLDFYADWCISCKEMELYTFTNRSVQEVLANTLLLQADVTLNDEQDKKLMKTLGVYGPPTIIFYGSDGFKKDGYEVVGYMRVQQFISHVKRVLGQST